MQIRYISLLSLLWGFLGFRIVGIWSYILQLQLLGHAPYPMELAVANDRRVQLVGVLVLVTYLVSAVFFGRWILVANRAVHQLGAIGLRHSPGMAVGSFFVPFANFVWPYEAMSDLWRASINARSWQQNARSLALPFWWTSWLLTGVLGYGAIFLSKEAKTVDTLRGFTVYMVGTELVGVILSGFAIYIVRSISRQINGQFSSHQPLPPTPISVLTAVCAPVEQLPDAADR